MTTKVELLAQTRSESKAAKVRATGFIPAVVYGFGTTNQNIKVKKHDFEKTFLLFVPIFYLKFITKKFLNLLLSSFLIHTVCQFEFN